MGGYSYREKRKIFDPIAISVMKDKEICSTYFNSAIITCSLVWPNRFFPFFFVVVEKGSGDPTIGFACDKIPRFWGVLIAGDEPKKVLRTC